MYKLIKTQYLKDGTRASNMVEYEDEQKAEIEMMREIVYASDANMRGISVQILGEQGEYVASKKYAFNTTVSVVEETEEDNA